MLVQVFINWGPEILGGELRSPAGQASTGSLAPASASCAGFLSAESCFRKSNPAVMGSVKLAPPGLRNISSRTGGVSGYGSNSPGLLPGYPSQGSFPLPVCSLLLQPVYLGTVLGVTGTAQCVERRIGP